MKTDYDAFSFGVEVYYHGVYGKEIYGVINFVDESYLTLLIKKGERKVNDVNLVIHRKDWNKIVPILNDTDHPDK
jgi:hypothetical protein